MNLSKNYVLDASIIIKWFFPEKYHEQAALLHNDSSSSLHAPDFAQLECINLLSKKVRRNELHLDEANQIQELLLQLPVQMYPWQDFLLEAGKLAHEINQSIFDCLSLVLAKQIKGKMVTADKDFYLVLKTSKDWSEYILWIEDLNKTLNK